MDLSTVKVTLALAATWGRLPSTATSDVYVKADQEPHLRIFLQMPLGMPVG
uniref:Uncharacterized protein n=1 Tax=Peronospora matthiolae TaxID=2874970 RepID=A0AAV1UQ98_9STRA